MASSRTSKGSDAALKTLDGFILIVNVAKDACGSIPPAQIALASASTLLTMIREFVTNKQDFIELGQSCADVCDVLYRGLEGRELEKISKSVLDAIGRLATTVDSIQTEVRQHQGSAVSRFFHAKVDKDKLAGWNRSLVRFHQIFDIELLFDVHRMVADLHLNQERTSCPHQLTQASAFVGEMPPPAPESCFGREEIIEKVIALAKDLKSIALIGAGGIGKTTIALSVLHHPQIEAQFGHERRFFRCDEFPASHVHLLSRLAKVIGAPVDNPESLAPLLPFLSSKKMFIIFDNTESIIDPQGADAQKIYAIIHQLCRIKTVCVLITSRIRTVPPHCARPEIPTLSMEAARDIFYDIYGDHSWRSDIIDDLPLTMDDAKSLYPSSSSSILSSTPHASQPELGYMRSGKDLELSLPDPRSGCRPESDVSVSSPSRDEGYDIWDIVAAYIFLNSEAERALMHHDDLIGIHKGGDTDNLVSLLVKHKPHVEVDRNGVGRIVSQGTQQLRISDLEEAMGNAPGETESMT